MSVPEDTTAAEELAKQQEALKNPSMDEVEIPVITDDMLPDDQPKKEDFPTMDSVTLPGQKPKPVQIAKPAPTPAPAPAPIPQPSVVRPMNAPQQVQPTPRVQNTYQQPQPVIPPQNNGYQQPNMPMNNMPPQNNMPMNSAPQNNGVTPGKSANNIVPIILVVAIIVVILVDVFVVFKKQIFGKDKDSGKDNAAVVTVVDDTAIN